MDLANDIAVGKVAHRALGRTAELFEQGYVAQERALEMRRHHEVRNQAANGVVAGQIVERAVEREQICSVQPDAKSFAVEDAPERLLHAAGIAEVNEHQVGTGIEIRDCRAKIGQQTCPHAGSKRGALARTS